MRSGLRDWFGHSSTKVAVALAIVGTLFVLLELQNPSKVYWTGQAVEGTDRGGIIYYEVHGQQYTIDDQRRHFVPEQHVTVYVDPADPSHALLPSPSRWIDAVVVLVWFVAGLLVLVVSALRRRASPPARMPHWP